MGIFRNGKNYSGFIPSVVEKVDSLIKKIGDFTQLPDNSKSIVENINENLPIDISDKLVSASSNFEITNKSVTYNPSTKTVSLFAGMRCVSTYPVSNVILCKFTDDKYYPPIGVNLIINSVADNGTVSVSYGVLTNVSSQYLYNQGTAQRYITVYTQYQID